jgi:flagellar export protein FliJ
MKARWFRLQSVLDHRAANLEEAQNSLSLALADLGAALNNGNLARCQANTIADKICSASNPQSASQAHTSRQAYLDQIRRIQLLDERVQECRDIVQKWRLAVVKASREHEILVRLREKRLKAAQHEEARKEETMLSDLLNSQKVQTLRLVPEEYLQT